MSVLFKLIRLGFVLGALGVVTLSVMALFGFAVPVFDLFNHAQIFLLPGTFLALVILVVALRGRMRVAALAYGLVGFAASASIILPEGYAAMQQRPPAPESGTVRMMTHNLFGMNYEMEQVTAAILAEDPDIIVFQEYFGEQSTDLHPLLVSRYPYFVHCRGGKRANLGLYSRLPFEQEMDGACPDNAYGTARTAHIIAKFAEPDGDQFTVITTHMDWPIPVSRQQEQLGALSDVLDTIEGPLVLAGDFNSTAWSYALREFVSGNGLTRQTLNMLTFPMSWFYFGAWRDTLPFLPLDHVMTRGGVVVHDIRTGRPTASDHLPVVFDFSIAP